MPFSTRFVISGVCLSLVGTVLFAPIAEAGDAAAIAAPNFGAETQAAIHNALAARSGAENAPAPGFHPPLLAGTPPTAIPTQGRSTAIPAQPPALSTAMQDLFGYPYQGQNTRVRAGTMFQEVSPWHGVLFQVDGQTYYSLFAQGDKVSANGSVDNFAMAPAYISVVTYLATPSGWRFYRRQWNVGHTGSMGMAGTGNAVVPGSAFPIHVAAPGALLVGGGRQAYGDNGEFGFDDSLWAFQNGAWQMLPDFPAGRSNKGAAGGYPDLHMPLNNIHGTITGAQLTPTGQWQVQATYAGTFHNRPLQQACTFHLQSGPHGRQWESGDPLCGQFY